MSKSKNHLIAPKVIKRREMSKEITRLKNMLTFEEQDRLIAFIKRILRERN